MIPVADVVVLTWNDGPLLDVCVRSVLASEAVDVHVVVVDNGSEPAAEVPDDPRVHLLRNATNRGVAPARNQGVAAGRSPYVCLLDSDAALAPASLAALLAPLSDPEVGVSVPVFVDQEPEASAGLAPTLRVKLERAFNRRSTYEQVPRSSDAPQWDVDFGIGACQAFTREVFDEVGGLDEAIFYGPEDVDFCLRVQSAGRRIVQVRDGAVVHPPRRAFRRPLSRAGLRHGVRILHHLWRHRGRRPVMAGPSGEPR